MHTDWKAFLENRGAEIKHGMVITFPSARQPDADGRMLFDLSHLGLLAAQGEDAETFLQGQFGNDVRSVTTNRAQISSLCNPKGRMLAVFYLFRREASFCLQLPGALVGPILNRLRMYVLRAKVRLRDASDELVRIGFSGPNADEVLSSVVGNIPDRINQVAHAEGMTLIRMAGPQPRFELLGDLPSMETLWDQLSASSTPAPAAKWSLQDIRAGIPTIYPETSEAFVPQMANMELIDGVSFTKGCYPGQEVVARSQYLGKLKRRMYLARVEAHDRPGPGTPLFSAATPTDQSIGKVVAAEPSPNDGFELLAVIQVTHQSSGEVRLGSPEGPSLQFEPLPYPLPVEETE